MSQFRTKPAIIDAVRYDGANAEEVNEFMDGSFATLDHLVSVGDWVIKGIKGEFYPCKADIFAATYEAVEHYDL